MDISIPEFCNHIRKRPGMYIGNQRVWGKANMLREMLWDICGQGTDERSISITLLQDYKVRILIERTDIECLFRHLLHTESLYQIGFENGFGIWPVVALSEEAYISVHFGDMHALLCAKNAVAELAVQVSEQKKNFAVIEFKLDHTIFSEPDIPYEIIFEIGRAFAYLNLKTSVTIEDTTVSGGQRNAFFYPNGISELIENERLKENYEGRCSYGSPFFKTSFNAKIKEHFYQVALVHTNEGGHITSFANEKNTTRGGSHQVGAMQGLTEAFRIHAQRNGLNISVTRSALTCGLYLAVAIKQKGMVYIGAIRNKIDMPEVRKHIKDLVCEHVLCYLASNPEEANMIMSKFAMR